MAESSLNCAFPSVMSSFSPTFQSTCSIKDRNCVPGGAFHFWHGGATPSGSQTLEARAPAGIAAAVASDPQQVAAEKAQPDTAGSQAPETVHDLDRCLALLASCQGSVVVSDTQLKEASSSGDRPDDGALPKAGGEAAALETSPAGEQVSLDLPAVPQDQASPDATPARDDGLRGEHLQASEELHEARHTNLFGLPPLIYEPFTDLCARRLWGRPVEEDPPCAKPGATPRSLLAIAVGSKQMALVDAMVVKFGWSEFDIVLFHYDSNVDVWKERPWFNNVTHVAVPKQTKWWFAKRFLHPDVVHGYEFIFIWDEDIGVDDFDPKRYMEVARRHALDVSQPALGPRSRWHWWPTKRQPEGEMHRGGEGQVSVEIMVPVFSRKAWPCVWHMLQNDLVHGWGLDQSWYACVGTGADDVMACV
eukprot:jgi/Mesvir1/13461/Mv16520-RA.1